MFILVAWVDVAPFFSEVVVPVLAHSNWVCFCEQVIPIE